MNISRAKWNNNTDLEIKEFTQITSVYAEPLCSCIYSSIVIFERSGEIVLWGRLYKSSVSALWTCIGYRQKSDLSIFSSSFENIKWFARSELKALLITYVRNGFVYGTTVDGLPRSSSIITTLGRFEIASVMCTTIVVRDVSSLPYYCWSNFYERCAKSIHFFYCVSSLRVPSPCEVLRTCVWYSKQL